MSSAKVRKKKNIAWELQSISLCEQTLDVVGIKQLDRHQTEMKMKLSVLIIMWSTQISVHLIIGLSVFQLPKQ